MIIIDGKAYPYQADTTVLEAVSQLGIQSDNMVLVVIDGRVMPWNQLDQELIQDGVEIRLLHIVSGG